MKKILIFIILSIISIIGIIYIINKFQYIEYNKIYDKGFIRGAECGSKLGYDMCIEILERIQ